MGRDGKCLRKEEFNYRYSGSTLYSIDIIHLETVDSDFREIVLANSRKIYG